LKKVFRLVGWFSRVIQFIEEAEGCSGLGGPEFEEVALEGAGRGGVNGKSLKEGRDRRKSAAPCGLFHRERTSRSVGEAEHLKMCFVVCGKLLQAGQMSSGDEPTVF
jgi:hypothetical protein